MNTYNFLKCIVFSDEHEINKVLLQRQVHVTKHCIKRNTKLYQNQIQK